MNFIPSAIIVDHNLKEKLCSFLGFFFFFLYIYVYRKIGNLCIPKESSLDFF
jgi:hypothetical protein